ncbi:unnamed protein product [Bursaphelenchus xylophilus]|uniref:(pine wood nematode) hypothetical protein n=1 Tax=Bursaphelenchus xylophilus TaxID=6326 RepID=A0A811K7W6_BURXY|nr:unnamed protein product [Bursaphelenchus xylophilus]CAG9089224.1 unnamed protein product [Bursaphelenchus xylophilus]
MIYFFRNPALKSVNLWNAFPDPTFSVPIPAQDGTYMAETLTNDLDNMEYVAPMFHCPTPNVYHPFFAINLNITFTPATPLSIRNTHSSLPLAPLSSPITLSSGFYDPFVIINSVLKPVDLWSTFPDRYFQCLNFGPGRHHGRDSNQRQKQHGIYCSKISLLYPKCLRPIFHYESKHHLHSRHTPFHLQHPSSPPTRTAPLLRSTPTTLLPHHTLFRIDLQVPCNGYL